MPPGQCVAQTEPVLQRIKNTGIFNAGTRSDVIPFAYYNPKKQLIGFSIDLIKVLHKKIEQRLGRSIELKLSSIPAGERIEAITRQIVDIECGITTPTWARQEVVDFSIPFFINGTRIMTLRTTATRIDELEGKRIGAVVGSTTVSIIKKYAPTATIVEVPDLDTGFAMFVRGELDGLSNIDIVLRAKVETSPLKSSVTLIPRNHPLTYESVACILPQNQSEWRTFVNQTLADLLEGVNQYRGDYIAMYERWFGPRGTVYFPLDITVAERLAASIIWLR
jgi:polar amino acid transport system substrate-binding protein